MSVFQGLITKLKCKHLCLAVFELAGIFSKCTLDIIDSQGPIMEPVGWHWSFITEQQILDVFRLVGIVLRCTLIVVEFQDGGRNVNRSMMEPDGCIIKLINLIR
ncbi:hypothetical protein EVAR_59418_1 [Eumeta japonica]|uniref:Uncharacterized protein n=1 Tax=Eumeta variegata TaxID=151549 RepID=A0A4C1YYL4_EUMVA|nr:hypothetical protein EVAR_59418_1 [Eumeta japonica]